MPLLLKFTITPNDEDSAIEHQTVILPVIGYREEEYGRVWALDPAAIALGCGYYPVRALYDKNWDGDEFLFVEYSNDEGTISTDIGRDEIVVEVVKEYPSP